jgi:hypothetical protein
MYFAVHWFLKMFDQYKKENLHRKTYFQTGGEMKRSTKFFMAATVVNVLLSVTATFTTVLKEVRVVDLVTFYATAFGAGASVVSMVVSLRNSKSSTTE